MNYNILQGNRERFRAKTKKMYRSVGVGDINVSHNSAPDMVTWKKNATMYTEINN